jgi:glyoxylase-like metal-dependent hydrolase (beta-lactamase superfamily II)
MVVFDRKSRGIFCGDALGMLAPTETPFPLPNTAPPNFDQKLYLETIAKLRQLGARILFYSHGGEQHEADALIALAAENTRVFGDMALEGLRGGAAPQVIAQRIGDYVSSRFGLHLEELHLQMVVHGYIFYLRNVGLA